MSNHQKTLSLQDKVSLSLFAVMAVLAVLSYSIVSAVIAPAFDDLELTAAETNIVRVDRAIDAELEALRRLALDWAPWDDTFLFVQGEYPAFEVSNLPLSVMNDLELDLILFYNTSRNLHWGTLLVDERVRDVASSGIFATGNSTEAKLTSHEVISDEILGLLQTDHGPMLIVSLPITHTDRRGPIAGSLIIGRLLDDSMLSELKRRTEVDFSWYETTDESSQQQSEATDLRYAGPEAISNEVTKDRIRTFFLRRDLNDKPILLLVASTPREISALGQHTLNGALLLLAAATVIVSFVIWLLLRNMIIKPLELISTHISSIHESGDLTRRLNMSRSDEIGAVGRNFDEMAGELNDARQLLLEQSFKAGKADTAAEVMHNIRNAMTPLINGIDRLGTAFKITDGLKVGQATKQIADLECTPDRKNKLLKYVDSAFKHIEESHAESRGELDAVSKQAKLVESIISDQDRHAHSKPVIESLELDKILDEAVLVIPKQSSPSVRVNLQEELGEYRVKGHRVGLLQVLGNIILNAYEAIQRSESGSGSISLSASNETIDDQEMIRLVVSDTGCGFDDKSGRKLFQRGYTSKSGDLNGLGLHWCANAIAAMGGRIKAESTGAGQGAQFHLLLPAAHGG